ncbi:MAG: metal-dependent transcriptional regulator [Firmicutes bacterium]|nr:metal-dependent transcriptional regulator [Bacillota bacterium]
MHLQESGEMYLETILILSKKSRTVRSLDVAEYMGYSKPSVSRAIGLLKKGGYVVMDGSGYLFLTEDGEKTAAKIYERHTMLTQFLVHLGVDEKTAAEDACKIEHDISDQSFEAIKRHAGQAES